MISRRDLRKINDYLWEISQAFRQDMKVPARLYASEQMLEQITRDRALEQLINVASLPGIVRYSLAMPDIHQGYGFPIGGVAATRLNDGAISPGGVGYDINCGVRLLKSDLIDKDVQSRIDGIAIEIQKEVPSGLGKGRKEKISLGQIDKVLKGGVPHLVTQGYGNQDDVENCESGGKLEQADPLAVSDRARNRGRGQLGTLGSGNHFCEIQKVDEIFDEEVAQTFGLSKDQIVVMLHSGSRGLGHQVASDYIRALMTAMNKYGIRLPDRELACVPLASKEGQRYFRAMAAAANFAWANRHIMMHYVRKAWKNVFGQKQELELLYDVAHNIAKIEEYEINGKKEKLCVHRKGATRAFPPGSSEIPKKYQEVGQPVLIPGSMGTASYVLVGTKTSEQAFFSTCHGAGRTMSRRQATRTISGQQVVGDLKRKGIVVKCYSMRGIAEEAPLAYKNIDDVVTVVHNAGLAKKVARLVPLAVIKGE